MAERRLEAGKFLVAIPRLRSAPYWEVHPESNQPDPYKEDRD